MENLESSTKARTNEKDDESDALTDWDNTSNSIEETGQKSITATAKITKELQAMRKSI